jgi:hypothetical protein
MRIKHNYIVEVDYSRGFIVTDKGRKIKFVFLTEDDEPIDFEKENFHYLPVKDVYGDRGSEEVENPEGKINLNYYYATKFTGRYEKLSFGTHMFSDIKFKFDKCLTKYDLENFVKTKKEADKRNKEKEELEKSNETLKKKIDIQKKILDLQIELQTLEARK